MSKNEFLDQLSILLSDVSPDEKEEVLAYYREYIEDAGLENEEAILEELGTPETVAAEIKSGMLNKNNQDINYSSNTVKHSPETYNSTKNDQTYSYNYGNTTQQPAPKKKTNVLLIILAILGVILLSPVWIGLLSGLLGIVIGLFATIFGSLFGFALAGIACFILGIIVFVIGISLLFQNPVAAIACLAIGLIITALGILFLLLTGWICIKVIPWLIRSISNLIHHNTKHSKEAHV